MKYIVTDFYEDFICVGGECLDSCCIGWDIFVDDNTYAVYEELPVQMKEKVCQQIHKVENRNGVNYKISMKEDGRCPFLNEHNLCNIFIEVSPDAMCQVCKTFPRKRVNCYDVVMATVSTSCPEVARILLERKEPISFSYGEDSITCDVDMANWPLFNELINGLVVTTNILQDREYPFWKRLHMSLYLTELIQSHIDEDKLEVLRESIGYIGTKVFREKYINEQCATGVIDNQWQMTYSLLSMIEKLGMSLEERLIVLQKYKEIAPNDEEGFRCWNNYFINHEEDFEIEMENLAIEFVFEYYMDALKGKSLLENMVKMLLLLLEIKVGEIIHYKTTGFLKMDDKTLLISKICRCMENTALLDIASSQLVSTNEKQQLIQLAYLLQ